MSSAAVSSDPGFRNGPKGAGPGVTPRLASRFRRRRLLAVLLALLVATGASVTYLGERSARAARVAAAVDAALVTEQTLRDDVADARSGLQVEIAAASAVLGGTDLDTPDAPEEVRALANVGVDPAAVETLRTAVAEAETRLTAPVELSTRPDVVENVRVDVPVATTPAAAELEESAAAVLAAAETVRLARVQAATQEVLLALPAAEQRLAAWEPIAADPATLTELKAAVAAGVAVRDGSAALDLAALRTLQADLEQATADHAEIVTRPDGPTTIGGIPVISKAVPLPVGYDPGLLPEVEAAFAQMAASAATEAGLTLVVASGYRSYSDQQVTYDRWAALHGTEYADRFSSRAGFSEHQSGLALDVNEPSRAFDGTPEAVWVAENAHRFGFVVRYPEGKEAVTGYVYEPWHLRHLGVDLATVLVESGLTLEEHLGIRADYGDEAS